MTLQVVHMDMDDFYTLADNIAYRIGKMGFGIYPWNINRCQNIICTGSQWYGMFLSIYCVWYAQIFKCTTENMIIIGTNKKIMIIIGKHRIKNWRAKSFNHKLWKTVGLYHKMWTGQSPLNVAAFLWGFTQVVERWGRFVAGLRFKSQ